MPRTIHLCNAAVFTLVNKTEVTFDIRVKAEASLVILVLIDMDFSIYDPGTNIRQLHVPVVTSGPLPGSSVTLDGSLSERLQRNHCQVMSGPNYQALLLLI